MYGLVNKAVQDLIVKNYGVSVWEEIKKKVAFKDEEFEVMKPYEDALTYKILTAACEIVNTDINSMLRSLGRFWILFTAYEGYGDMMDLFGKDFNTCLKNLNSMHARMGASFSELKPPRFIVKNINDTDIYLEYHSSRKGLGPMVYGLLEGLAEKFKTKVSINQKERELGKDFDVFIISKAI